MAAGQVFRPTFHAYLQWPVVREDATPLGTTDIASPLDVSTAPGSSYNRALLGALTARRRWSSEQYGQWPSNRKDATPLGTTDIASPLDVSYAPGGAHDRALRGAIVSVIGRSRGHAAYNQQSYNNQFPIGGGGAPAVTGTARRGRIRSLTGYGLGVSLRREPLGP